MKYKCIKEMCLPKCDGDGFEIPNEYGFVTVGSIWERDDGTSFIGGDVHLDSLNDDCDFGWIRNARRPQGRTLPHCVTYHGWHTGTWRTGRIG